MHQVESYDKAKRESQLIGGENIEIDVKVEINVGSLYIPILDVTQLSTNHNTSIIPEEGQLILILFWSVDSQPCLTTFKELNEILKNNQWKPEQLRVTAINVDKEIPKILEEFSSVE